MKYLLLLSLFACLPGLAAGQTGSTATEPAPFRIKGELEGLPDGTIYLLRAGDYLGYTFETVDSTLVNDGEFELKGEINEPELYFIGLNKRERIPFFLEGGEITIQGNINQARSLSVEGGPLHREWVAMQAELRTMVPDQRKWPRINRYIRENPASPISPYLIEDHVLNFADYEQLNAFYQLLDPVMQAHRYGKRVAVQLAKLEKLQVGKVAPGFSLPDTLGKVVTLSSFRGKFVLLDFWASWCRPCREEHPAMKELYHQLKTENHPFEILAISGDFASSPWKHAIRQDAIPWPNLSDAKGFDGKVLQLYGIKSLPTTLLLDPEGKIIAKGLTGETLRQRIKRLFEE